MQIWLGVEEFAKIESAKINISSYTLLVGPNNSGKTFLMQLVQGINGQLGRLLDAEVMDILSSPESEELCKLEHDVIEKSQSCVFGLQIPAG